MKHRFPLKALCVAVFLGFGLVTAHAQPRIGIVDLRKVFDGFYKTKDADARIKEEAASLEKNGKSMLEDYKKANDEYKRLMEAATDPAISAEEKQKRQKVAEDQLRDIRQLEQQVQQFQNQSQTALMEKRRRMREQILREIREAVVAKSKAAGYSLVLDVAADSVNQTPIVLYTNGENDITEDLLKQLNASAPAGTIRN